MKKHLALSTLLFSFSLLAGPGPTTIYYSKKADGSLKFTDEPPAYIPTTRRIYKSIEKKEPKGSFSVISSRDSAPKAKTSPAKPSESKQPLLASQPNAVPTKKAQTRQQVIEKTTYVKAVADVYVPESEIIVTYKPSYRSRVSSEILESGLPSKKSAFYQDMIKRVANEHNVEPALIAAIVQTESAYNTKAVSHKGARGLMQLMPQTAQGVGVEAQHLHDPEQNIRAGTKHIRHLLKRYQGDMNLALAAYNAGDSAVSKYRGVPPYRETIDYIARVRKYYRQFANIN